MTNNAPNRLLHLAAMKLVMVFAVYMASAGMLFAEEITVQGRLTDETSAPWTGQVSIEFFIYDVPENGDFLWTETSDVDVLNGTFSALLGSIAPLPDSIFLSSDRWLAVGVAGGAEQSERFHLTASPLAIHANIAESAPPNSLDGGRIETGAITLAKLAACNVGEIIVLGANGWACRTPGTQE